MNRTIIITGASSGIGEALALEYARRKDSLVLVARREQLLRDVASAVIRLGGTAEIVVGDLSEADTAAHAADVAMRAFGRVDVGIMNAGIDVDIAAREFDAAMVDYVMSVNYGGTVRMIAALLPGMLAEGSGTLVAISSLAAYRGMPGSSAYSASKAAVNTLMESLRSELHGSGIRACTIAPGFIDTPMTRKNAFHMPFMMSQERAARRIIRAIDRGRSEYRFPLGTSVGVRLLQMMPNFLYDPLMSSIRATSERVRTTSPASAPPSRESRPDTR